MMSPSEQAHSKGYISLIDQRRQGKMYTLLQEEGNDAHHCRVGDSHGRDYFDEVSGA